MDELLKQDANTFITAFSTAFILNGGKAIAIKIQGKDVQINPEDLEKCIDRDGNMDVDKLLISDINENTTDNHKTIKSYVENIKEHSSNGTTIEEYCYNNGIDILKMNDKISVAKELGDSKLYLLESTKEVLKNGNLSETKRKNLSNILKSYEKESVGNIEVTDMLTDLQNYLSKEQIDKAIDLAQTGTVDSLASKYTQEQLNAIFNYTKCGGFEINAWLNDIDTPGRPGIKARDSFKNISEIQDAVSGYRGNRILDSNSADILNEIDSLISSTNYDKAITTYRGVKELWDVNRQIDVKNLKVGDSFSSEGYQSSSVVFDNCYGVTKSDTNIILEIIVPPNSGTAAYIENITGVTSYGQMEMLIKRNAKMTVADNIRFVEIDGQMKTIVPVIVE